MYTQQQATIVHVYDINMTSQIVQTPRQGMYPYMPYPVRGERLLHSVHGSGGGSLEPSGCM